MDSIGSIGAAINRRERAARKAQGMTREQFKALAKGDRVVVISSGKVYEVIGLARYVGDAETNRLAAKAAAEERGVTYYSWDGGDGPDGWQMPSFVQWRTGEPKYPNGRQYGPCTKLKPENVRRQEVQVMDAIEAAALRKASEAAALAEALKCIDQDAMAAEADAGFDAGEFSGPAHDRRLAADLAAIAARHGITADRLDDLVAGWCAAQAADDACSCGSRPGDGLTDGCEDPDGCGYWRAMR